MYTLEELRCVSMSNKWTSLNIIVAIDLRVELSRLL